MSATASTVQCTCTPSRGLACRRCYAPHYDAGLHLAGYDWLSPIIASQAAHYGLTEERFTSLMTDVADYQEVADTELDN